MRHASRATRRGVGTLAGLAAITTTILCAASAQAATVPVGSSLNGTFQAVPFGGSHLTLVQRTLPAGANVTSPVDGTVVSYRVAVADGTFAIQVVRFSGDAGQSIANSTPTAITTSGISAPVATSLVIQKGDSLGIRNFGGGDELGAIDNDSTYSLWEPPLIVGTPPRNPDDTVTRFEVGVQATVRYCQVPKVKGKSPKKARSALAAADCTVGKVKKTKKVRKKKKVLSQSVAPGTAISDTAPVNLKVSRKRR